MNTLLKTANNYTEVYEKFRWKLPQRYNIAWDVCDRHARFTGKVALIHDRGSGSVQRYTFQQVRRLANRCANMLSHLGLTQGDRVMIYLGQDPVTAITHIGCWKAGLISVPTSVLFGSDALTYRLRDSGARVVITDSEHYPVVEAVRNETPELQHVLLSDGMAAGALDFWKQLEEASDSFETLPLTPDTPAFISYTSGTTGNAKGALHGHRSMLGHMPGLEMVYDRIPQEADVMWSPADWSWMGGLMDVLMPGWYCGIPVLTYRKTSFDPEESFHLMGRHGVRVALLPPTVLHRLSHVSNPISRYGVDLRVVLSGGEPLGEHLYEWAATTLRTQVNEGYGQTECNVVLGNCARLFPPKPGSMGLPLPGHVASILDEEGQQVRQGEVGQLAFRAPDPVMMLEYWRNPQATRDKFIGEWLVTGDLARCDEDGYYWYVGRADDVITSAGYRIGPGEIEDAINAHPAVSMSAVIGVPDLTRTEAIRAYVVLRPDYPHSSALAESIRESVRKRLARHESPRDIEFVDALPMTVTGKILRRELRERARQGL